MKGLFTPALLVAALSISGCELTLDEKEKLDNAAADLQQLADQIIITYPAKDSEVSDSVVTVRADIPASAQAQEVRLLVDGIEIAKDSDGAPWEIQWPAYLFADGGKHTLLLKTITGEGNEVRNNEQFQLTVSEQANKALTFEEGINGKSIQDQGSLSFTFNEFEGASGYEILIDGDYDNLLISNTAEIELNNLSVGNHTVQYRVLHDRLDSTPFSEEVTFEVLPAALPIINEPIIDGINITLSWEAISVDDSYSIYWGAEGSSLELLDNINTNSYSVIEAAVGQFEWSIRRTNALGQQSVMSNKAVVELLPPALPVINEPVVVYKEDGYQVTLSWETIEEDDNYTVYFAKKSESLQAQATTTGNDLVLTGLDLGQYQWQLKRTNTLSQSVINEVQALSIGVFTREIGGLSNEFARQLIPTRDNGSLIRADTNSQDSQGDDLLIKLDENGNTEWELILNKAGRARLSDIIEFDDGSLYAIGYNGNWDDAKGYLIKINAEKSATNRIAWEKEYRSEGAEKELFDSLTEVNGTLYGAGYVQVCEAASTNCQYIFKLHEFNTNNGDILSSISLPNPEGILLTSIEKLSATSNNNILVACNAKLETSFSFGCILNIQPDGTLNWSWHSKSIMDESNYAVETPWGGFLLSGNSLGFLHDTVIEVFDANGSSQRTIRHSYGRPTSNQKVIFDNNDILTLISDSDLPELWSSTQYGQSGLLKAFTELDSHTPVSITKSINGELLLLFTLKKSNNSFDILVMKTDMQGNM